jgi:competence protein ComEC
MALAFATGIVIARFFPPPAPLLLALLLAVLSVWIARQRWDLPELELSPVVWAAIPVFILGALRFQWEEAAVFRGAETAYQLSRWNRVTITGTVDRPPDPGREWGRMVLRDVMVESGGRRTGLGMKVAAFVRQGTGPVSGEAKDTFRPGDRIGFPGRVREIRGAGLPGGFDFREYMASRGVFALTTIGDPEQVSRLGTAGGPGNVFRRLCFGLRWHIIRIFETRMEPAQSDLLRAMMLGERTALPVEMQDAVRHSGLAHLTVVSGLHFSILIALFAGTLKIAGLRRRDAALCTIPFVLLLLGLTGFALATTRAALMGLIIIGALLFRREADSMNDLALAMLVLLLISPLHLFRVGFQLSFLAVTGILLVARPVRGWLEGRGMAWNWWYLAPVSTVGAVLGTAPAIAYHFGTFTPVAVVANLLAVPLATVILWLGSAGAVLGLLWEPLAGPIVNLNAVLLQWLAALAGFFAELPGAWMRFARPPLWWVAGMYLLLVLMAAPGGIFPVTVRGFRLRKHHALLSVLALLIWLGVPNAGRGELAVNFLSVGAGDATLVEFPGGGVMLVDAGPPKQASQVDGYLHSRGIRRVDIVVVTHSDADHLGGIPTVLEHYDVGMAIDPGIHEAEPLSEEYRRRIRERRIPRVFVDRGDLIEGVEDVEISVLNPPPKWAHSDEATLSESSNEGSIVLLLRYGRVSVLLTGDIGHPTEKDLFEAYGDLDCTALKVPHHGSRFSSSPSFVWLADPEVAVIEVGENPYGHPASEVVERYRRSGAFVFRTDRDGIVRFVTDGKTYRVETSREWDVPGPLPSES